LRQLNKNTHNTPLSKISQTEPLTQMDKNNTRHDSPTIMIGINSFE